MTSGSNPPVNPDDPAAKRTRTRKNILRDISSDNYSRALTAAAVDALIHEIRITEKGLIPVYRIPASDMPIPGHDTNQRPVRTNGPFSGAGGARTHDRRIMSPGCH